MKQIYAWGLQKTQNKQTNKQTKNETKTKQKYRNTEKMRHVSKKKQTCKFIKIVSNHQHLYNQQIVINNQLIALM